MDGWNRIVSFLGQKAYFQGKLAVSFREFEPTKCPGILELVDLLLLATRLLESG